MTTKKKSLTNAKVTKMSPKPKMPTKEEMFNKALMPTFESMLKADRNRLNTIQGIESVRNIIDNMYGDQNGLLLDEKIERAVKMCQEFIKPHIDALANIILAWDYKTFMDIKDNPFADIYKDDPLYQIKSKQGLITEWHYIAMFIFDTITSAYISKIQEGQRQLNNCE